MTDTDRVTARLCAALERLWQWATRWFKADEWIKETSE